MEEKALQLSALYQILCFKKTICEHLQNPLKFGQNTYLQYTYQY